MYAYMSVHILCTLIAQHSLWLWLMWWCDVLVTPIHLLKCWAYITSVFYFMCKQTSSDVGGVEERKDICVPEWWKVVKAYNKAIKMCVYIQSYACIPFDLCKTWKTLCQGLSIQSKNNSCHNTYHESLSRLKILYASTYVQLPGSKYSRQKWVIVGA